MKAAAAKAERPLRVATLPWKPSPNPYSALLYGALERHAVELVPEGRLRAGWLLGRRRAVDVLHFGWKPGRLYEWRSAPPSLRLPLSYLRLVLFASRLALARAVGYRLVWTIHEVLPHESYSRRLDRVAARVLAVACHVLVVHDDATVARVRTELGVERPVSVVPHGSYVGVYPPGRGREELRSELGVGDATFLFLAFGSLRRHKELPLLLEGFGLLDRPDVALVVAGEADDPSVARTVTAAAAHDPRVRTLLEHVDHARVRELFAAADAAVCSRGDGWTSGALILALSHGLPVVAARQPAYVALTGDGAAGWHFEPGSAPSLAAALRAASADAEEARRRGAAALARAESLRWEDTAAALAVLLRGPGTAAVPAEGAVGVSS